MLLYLCTLYEYIDVTSMMTMFAIDIWGDRHASESVILYFGVHCVRLCSQICCSPLTAMQHGETVLFWAHRCTCSSMLAEYAQRNPLVTHRKRKTKPTRPSSRHHRTYCRCCICKNPINGNASTTAFLGTQGSTSCHCCDFRSIALKY